MTYPENPPEGQHPFPGTGQPVPGYSVYPAGPQAQYPPQYYQPPQTESSNLAIAALVLGILSLTGCSCLTGIPAIICARTYLGKNLPENRALAQVGFWLGVVATAIGVITVLVYGALIAFGLAGGFGDLPDQN
ncbi:MAG: DUF4190 domain-containing protein [Segniliparus sp.]|uniref:DUF4190 domain-containing protein n=1 Tax=Segniliparus sp. TaxID=2804064 RepID=UPI003F40E986